MAYNNVPVVYKQHEKFSLAISKEQYQSYIKTALRDPKRAENFIATVNSAVATNRTLQECNPYSIMSAALMGESLGLPYSFGYFYLVPYDVKVGKTEDGADIKDKMAQFQMGYKGYIQLAIRSGQYKDILVSPVKEGELKKYNRITGEIEIEPIEDEDIWENTPTIGYFAKFETKEGFNKILYWKYEKMLNHADKYSAAFSKDSYIKLKNGEIPQKDMRKYSSFWYKNFDDMACKTMLRQLLSKWGLLSTEMRAAYTSDMSVYNENGEASYIDNPLNDFSNPMELEQPEKAKEIPETPFQAADDELPFPEAEAPEDVPDFLKS